MFSCFLARSHVKEQKSPLSDIFSANTILLATLATLASTVVVVYAPVYIEKHFAACHSPKCMDLRTDLALMMDSEADPCRDFYRFVCANFESVYPPFAKLYGRLHEASEAIVS
ncbi:hypothetical protein MRX96_052452 [Rhipicephalus microplus]